MGKLTEEKIQENYERDMKKILPYGIRTDAQGRYLLYLDNTNTSKAYFADKTGARKRIATSTFHRWIAEGKAVEVSDDELPRIRKKRT